MALSGSVTTSSSQGRSLTLTWTATQNISNNTSTISWELKGSGQSSSGGGSYWVVVSEVRVKIDGSQAYYRDANNHTNCFVDTVIATGTKTITHNSDGNKTFNITVEAGIYQFSINCSGSADFTLNQIPRKATITSATSFNDEGNPSLTYSNPAGNAVTTLEASVTFWNLSTRKIATRTASKTGNSLTITLTDSEREYIRNQMVNESSCSVYYYIKTVIGGVTYTDWVEKTISITGATPTITGSFVDTRAVTYNLTGDNKVVVYGESEIQYTVYPATYKSATLSSLQLTMGGNTINNQTTGTFSKPTSNIIKANLVDSRGKSTTATWTRNYVAYFKPTITVSSNVMTADGKFTASINGTFFNGSFGAASNTVSILISLREVGSDFSSLIISPTISGNNLTATYTFSGLDYRKTYEVRAQIQDRLYTIQSSIVKVISQPVFDWSMTDFNFNVPVEINGDLVVNGAVTANSGANTWNALTLQNATNYDSSNPCKYKKAGDVVTVIGAIKPGNANNQMGSTGDGTHIFTLPEGYRPPYDAIFIGQGSGSNIFLLTIYTTGTGWISRYRSGDTYSTPATSAWLSFCCTYVV